MSSDFERELRDARETLPVPGDAVTLRARRRAVAALRPRKPRIRVAALVAVAFVSALVVGVGLGSFVAPSTTASDAPAGLGFLPEDGWYVLQAGTDATPERPAVAIASNFPISPEDGSSIVPYTTLLGMPASGIVIVANFTGRIEEATAHVPSVQRSLGFGYPAQELPLRIRDATPYIQFGGQIRPEEPLGQYQLRATVKGYAVELFFYFGSVDPSPALLAEAQTQLDRLVVRRGRAPAAPTVTANPADTAMIGAPVVLDRTIACNTVVLGGIREVEARAHRGYRFASQWSKLPYAVVSSGAEGGTVSGRTIAPDNSLAWITAGSPSGSTTVDDGFFTFPVRSSGTLGLNTTICNPSKAKIPLSSAGLRSAGSIAGVEELDCASPRRVLVRVRATLRSAGDLRRRGFFQATGIPVREAELVVRTESGKALVYAEVLQSGQTRLFTAKGCQPD